MILSLVFYSSVGLILYTYLLYPLVLCMISARKSEPARTESPEWTPKVSVIISAFNEEKHIQARIRNLLEQDYPSQQLEIIVGSDGSGDGTAERLAQFADHPQCSVHIFAQNRGKASVLNDLVAHSTGEILVFSDANTEFASDNIRKMLSYFVGPDVGGVCGELQIYDPVESGSENQDSLYWRYERFLKERASRLRCLPGANGANYAIRRTLFKPIPSTTIVDDMLIGCRVVLQGKELIYAKEAIAKEEQALTTNDEFKRRVRIGNGNYQCLRWLIGEVLRSSVHFRFVFFSHKVIRWFVPHLLVTAFISNAILAPGSSWFSLLLILQLLGYGLVMIIHLSTHKQEWPGAALALYFLIAMNVGLGMGFVRYLTRGDSAAWERTER
ncbi:MAG: glycosyltransferase family 2 protein [Pseudomonadota bacterium]